LLEPFTKDRKARPLGPLYKVRTVDEEKNSFPMVARVINFNRVQPYVIQAIFQEATCLRMLKSKYLLPISGMIFEEKVENNTANSVMHIFYPQKISLYTYIHESGMDLKSDDKYTIARNIAHAMATLHASHGPPAHTHLTSHNIMINPSDFHVYIADYGLKSLKKHMSVFKHYTNLT